MKIIKQNWVVAGAVLFMLPAFARAQLSVTAQVPPDGIFSKPQLWNLLVVNAGSEPAEIRIVLSMQDMLSRQAVMTGISTVMMVPPGTKVVQPQQAQPVQYNFSAVNIDKSPEGLLPVGNYQVCYQLLEIVHNEESEAAEDCITVEIEPMAPPLLALPEDQAQVDGLRPSFTWLPPSPLAMFSQLNYDFLLSKILPGQSAADAIQTNSPVYTTGGVTQNFLQYPSGLPPLDTASAYAWQVVARDQQRFAAKSEVWVFNTGKDSAKKTTRPAFVRLEGVATAPAVVTDKVLRFEYSHPARDTYVTASIVPLFTGGGKLAETGLKVSRGQNFIEFALEGRLRLDEGKLYELRVKGPDGTVRYMRFIIRTKNNQE